MTGPTTPRRAALLSLALLTSLSACDALPRDPEGTLEHVRASKTIRVGLTQMSRADRAIADKLISVVAQRTGARPTLTPVTTEPAFAALDEGRLDLVVGPFSEDSPWATDVAFGPPLKKAGSEDHPIEVKAAMRNGENRWIMLVEAASRQVSPAVATQ
ncbi:hypothetical protein FYJ91_08600 [Sphingomonas montanisoli]|uniref:ABC transporter substrate-binding protein n=1 Tax=Sphingomonas montanisoli TaxID=2606412 RepID=A0A5D9C8J7_9SPHN|nr:hypothetical protein FYJ91_08600 [Sphingomonas montanisoli]